jgi:hypothetical protein
MNAAAEAKRRVARALNDAIFESGLDTFATKKYGGDANSKRVSAQLEAGKPAPQVVNNPYSRLELGLRLSD